MKKNYFYMLLILLLYACTFYKTDNTLALEEVLDSTSIHIIPKKYSVDEVQKVYGEIKFNITKSEYNKLIPNKIVKIGGSVFDFIPHFNQQGRLYRLDIRGKEKQREGSDQSKGYLIRLIENKYGSANMIWKSSGGIKENDHGEPTLVSFPGEIESYKWDVGYKRIIISSEPLKDQNSLNISIGTANFYIYPIMSITHIKMAEDYNLVRQKEKDLSLEKESNKF